MAILSAILNDKEKCDTIREDRRTTCSQKLRFLMNADDLKDDPDSKKIKKNK